jgi:hypothetical protein
MFVRITSTPNSPRKSVKIVENIRIGDKVKQKILCHIGIAANEDMEVKLVAIAKEHIARLEAERNKQVELFDELPVNTKGRKPRREIKDIIPTNQVTLEPVYNLFTSNPMNANDTICKLVFNFLSQFFHSLRHFSSQLNVRSTIHRFGITTNLCNSVLLTTSTVDPIIS